MKKLFQMGLFGLFRLYPARGIEVKFTGTVVYNDHSPVMASAIVLLPSIPNNRCITHLVLDKKGILDFYPAPFIATPLYKKSYRTIIIFGMDVLGKMG